MRHGQLLSQHRNLAHVIASVLRPNPVDDEVVLGDQTEARVRGHHDALGSENVVALLPH